VTVAVLQRQFRFTSILPQSGLSELEFVQFFEFIFTETLDPLQIGRNLFPFRKQLRCPIAVISPSSSSRKISSSLLS
jgi:hypothetical protein